MDVAIIGAGLAGLSCAQGLIGSGHRVRLFDKGRGVGGRMATRRIETALGPASFDHGAQYFTVRDAAFGEQVSVWASVGAVAPYPAAGDDAWVGAPGMNAPLKHLAANLDIHFGVPVEIAEQNGGWRILGVEQDKTTFDAVIVATPAEQAAILLTTGASDFAGLARSTPSALCWAVLAAFPERLPFPDVLRDASAIGWAARNSEKPDRSGPESWVIQASPEWSVQHLEDERDTVAASLLAVLAAQGQADLPIPILLQAHRWRYARSGTLGRACLWNGTRKIGVCGDWLLGPRVENAWRSGTALAASVGTA